MKVCPKCGTQYGDDANFCTADAGRLVAMAAPAAAPAPAASTAASADLLVGRFQLGQRIGGGDTGAVPRAVDTQTGATVAVKLIAPAVLPPAAQVPTGGTFLIVTPDLPVSNLKEFVALIKANPGKYDYGSWGIGSGGHLQMEWLKMHSG